MRGLVVVVRHGGGGVAELLDASEGVVVARTRGGDARRWARRGRHFAARRGWVVAEVLS